MLLLRLTIRYARPYRWWVLGVFIFQLISTLAALLLPSMNAEIIDQGVARGDTDFIWATGVNMLLICLAQLATAVIGVVLGSRVAMAVGRDLRRAVFKKVNQLSVLELGKFGPATLITRSTNDVQQVQILVLMALNLMISTPIMCIGGVIMALREDMSMSWLVWSSVLLLAIVVGWLVVLLLPMFREMQDRIDQINGVLREQIVGIRTVRAFVREAYESARYQKVNAALTRISVRVGNVFVLMFPVVMMILHLATAAVLWFGGHQVDAGTIQIGSLTAFLQYLLQILIAVMMGVFMMMMVPRAAVAAERIDEVLTVEPSGNTALNTLVPMPEGNRVVLNEVSFGYSGAVEQVIRNVSFTAEPAQMTAIVGATGAGKSTLINLLSGFYQTDSGELSIGGTPVSALTRTQLSQTIGLVPQRPFLFSGTVASNLRIGGPDATDDELWEALRIAQAEDFVRALPEGLAAPISQGGTNVSGGQRQRLCIARAIVARPRVFLLDDSFSALDVATDARLRSSLAESIAAGDDTVTTIVVAQRIATIANADRIVVLDRGSVVGLGTHHELIANCQVYRAIVESQIDIEPGSNVATLAGGAQ